MNFFATRLTALILFIAFALSPAIYTVEAAEPEGKDYLVSDLGGDFTLTNHNGGKTSMRDYRGKMVLIQFGYTFCPDVCPMGLTSLNVAMRELGDKSKNVQVLFISVDPERDTQERLKTFVGHFNKNFLGLTGTPEEITKVAALHGTAYIKNRRNEAGDYAIAHSAFTYIVGKDGVMREIIPFNAAPTELAKAILYFMEEEETGGK